MAGIMTGKRGSAPAAEDIVSKMTGGAPAEDGPAMGSREMKVSMAQDLISAVQSGDAEGVVDALEALLLEIDGAPQDEFDDEELGL